MFHFKNAPWGPYWDLIKPLLTLRRLEGSTPASLYDYAANSLAASFRYAHESDFIRLEILTREGGVYADMDTLFVRPIPDALFSQACVMGHEAVDRSVEASATGGSLCNALIMAEAGSKFLEIWQQRMGEAFDGSWSRHSTFLPYELSVEHPELIHVEPKSSFFYLDWTREGVNDLFLADVALPQSVYSLHLWAHLWWSRSRRDISRFHEGRLTPAYVRNAQTTYARLARPFLPKGIALGGAGTLRKEQATDWLRLFSDRLRTALTARGKGDA